MSSSNTAPKSIHPLKTPIYRPAVLRAPDDLPPADEFTRPENVSGPPTNRHWKPDAEARQCDDSSCSKTFSFLERRHHCRRCGNVFCAEHASHSIRLDQQGRFHPMGTLSRICDRCAYDYTTQNAVNSPTSEPSSFNTDDIHASSSRASRQSSLTSSPPNGGLHMPTVPVPNPPPNTTTVANVPEDWSWSTF